MRFSFNVEVEVERETGKFVSRDEIGEQVAEALESANPEQISAGDNSEYVVVDWVVEEEPQLKRKPKKRTQTAQAALDAVRQEARRGNDGLDGLRELLP